MPNLNSWIEAQLKRGYSRKQIKNALIRKGYSQKAVAEVDKVKVSSLQKNQLSKKSPNPFILVILIIGIILVVWFLLPSSQKQSGDIKLQTNEQAVNEETPLSIEEKKLIEAKAGEKAKEALKEFNADFCNSLIPENIRGMPLNEYSLNYHIDGSFGENVKWAASGQPKAEFSLFDSPKLFFVYSNNKFEGCGYLEKLNNIEKNSGFKNAVKAQLHSCNGKEVFSIKKDGEKYNEIGTYYFKSGEEMISVTIWAIPQFSDKTAILSNLGCNA